MIRLIAITLAAGLAATSASALTVNEPTFGTGDFPGGSSSTNPNIGTFSLGANTINGSLDGRCVPSYFGSGFDCNPGQVGDDTQDSFFFTVAAGTLVQDLTFSTLGSGVINSISVSIVQRSPFMSFSFPTTGLNQTRSQSFIPAIGPGTYNMSVFGQRGSAAGDYALDWTANFTVESTTPVPLPAGGWLLLAGLGGLARLRRRT